jgi:hypothetical protein
VMSVKISPYKRCSVRLFLQLVVDEDDLVDLRTVCFPGLNSVNPDSLNEISHIQACQKKPKMFVEILLY